MLNDALERRLASLAYPELRQIARRRLEGFTNREIADQLDCTERSVERRLERIRSKWPKIERYRSEVDKSRRPPLPASAAWIPFRSS